MSNNSSSCDQEPTFALDTGVKLGLEKIRTLAEQYEAGAASSPLTNRCGQLLAPSITKPLKVVFLAICETSREAALQLYLGKDLSTHFTPMMRSPDFESVEIQIQNRGFFINDGCLRQDFDTQDAFFNHLRTIQPGDGKLRSPLEIGVSLPFWKSGTCLVIAGNFRLLARAQDLMLRLSGAGDVLLLAGMEHAEPPENGEEVLELLCSGIPVVQALIIRKNSQTTNASPGWLKLLRSAVVATPPHAILSEEGPSSGGPQYPNLIGNLPRLQPLLGNFRIAREAMLILATLGQQIRSESERLAERRRMTEIPATTPNDQGFRSLSEFVASNLQSDVASLIRHIDDGTRDSLLPGGRLFQLVKKIAEDLDPKQLTSSLQPKATRYEAGEELCRSLRNSLLEQLVADMAAQKLFLEEAISASAEMVAAKVTETTGIPLEFKIPESQTDRLLNFATSLASAPLQLRTEIPRVTGTQFAWTCFQNPTMILMSLTMPMGMFLSSPEMGPILRKFKFDIALYGLVPIFLVTPFYLLNKLRKEAKFNLEREMERLRNTLQTDLERMARTVSDERRKFAGEWLKSVSDDIRKQAAANMAEISKSDEKRRSDEKQSQMATLQRLDVRLRELGQSGQLCDQLERDVRQSINTITSNLGIALRS